jgi:hypothetical protein
MSTDSISPEQREALLAFYRQEIAPLAERRLLDARVPPKADANATTYYKPRAWRKLEAKDFELRMSDPAEVGRTLDAFWQGTAFAGLGAKIAALAEKFPEVREREDVSSFIYEML